MTSADFIMKVRDEVERLHDADPHANPLTFAYTHGKPRIAFLGPKKDTAAKDAKKDGSPDAKSPRSNVIDRDYYDEKRIRQVCRWISTTTYVYLLDREYDPGIFQEVQATVWPPDDPSKAKLYVATNNSTTNNALATKLKTGTAKKILTDLTKNVSPSPPEGAAKLGERTTTHVQELADMLALTAPPTPKNPVDVAAFKTIFAALKHPITIAKGPKGAGPGMHAEQRLLGTIREERKDTDINLDPSHVGGLKRPCVFCYLALYNWPGATATRPGPIWFTTAASTGAHLYGNDEKAVARHVYETIKMTNETARPDGGVSYEVDTPSQTDSELEWTRNKRRNLDQSKTTLPTKRKASKSTAKGKASKRKASKSTAKGKAAKGKASKSTGPAKKQKQQKAAAHKKKRQKRK
jgi:hypothetical protein